MYICTRRVLPYTHKFLNNILLSFVFKHYKKHAILYMTSEICGLARPYVINTPLIASYCYSSFIFTAT